MADQPLAGLGRHHRLAAALEQRDAEQLLELADLHGKRRLADAAGLWRRGRNAHARPRPAGSGGRGGSSGSSLCHHRWRLSPPLKYGASPYHRSAARPPQEQPPKEQRQGGAERPAQGATPYRERRRHARIVPADKHGPGRSTQPGSEKDMDENSSQSAGKCPVIHGRRGAGDLWGRSNRDWWPNQLNLKILHQHSPLSDPWARLQLRRGVQDTRPRGAEEGPLSR